MELLLCLYKGVYFMLKEATISERKIVNAFIELLEESSLEQISITDIIKKQISADQLSTTTIQIKKIWLKQPSQRF